MFRPTSPINPLGNQPIGIVTGIFDSTNSLNLQSPEYKGRSQALLVGDPSLLRTSDYLVGLQTWFVAHIEPLRAASCILCNRTLMILTPAVASAAGANSYGGVTLATDTVLASSSPACVLAKTHIEVDPTRLPSDAKTSFFEVLLPVIRGLELTFWQLIQDELGQNYVVAAAELSFSGWRLLAGVLTT